MICYEDPAPVTRFNPGLPEEADRVLAKALEKDTALRHRDMASLLADLRKLKDRLAIPSAAQTPRISAKPVPPLAPRSHPRRRTLALAGFVLAAILLIALWMAWRGPRNDAVNLTPSIVVMPIEESGGDKQAQAMAEAVTGSLIVNLSKISGFRVISRKSAESLRTQKLSPHEIASRMPVDYVVEGSLARSGARSRLTVQMVRTADDTNLWAENFEFDSAWEDVLKVQQQVAERVVRQIRMYLDPADLTALRRTTNTNVAAYEEYARGHYSVIKAKYTLLPENVAESEHFLKHAAELDPKFVLPHVELANLYLGLVYPSPPNRDELLKRARSSLDRALNLDPQNAAAHYLLGFWHLENQEPRKALELCRRAVALAPNDSEAYYYLAMVYSAMGFYESALVTQEEAIRRDSFNLVHYNARVRFLVALDRLEEATRFLDVEREVDPSSIVPSFGLAAIQLRRGSLDEFLKTWEALAPARANPPAAWGTLAEAARALVAALRGDFGPGRRLVNNPQPLRYRQAEYVLLLPAVMGDAKLTKSLVRESSEYYNYRWLVTNPVMAKVVEASEYRDLRTELREKWDRDVREVGSSLPVMPPQLPPP